MSKPRRKQARLKVRLEQVQAKLDQLQIRMTTVSMRSKCASCNRRAFNGQSDIENLRLPGDECPCGGFFIVERNTTSIPNFNKPLNTVLPRKRIDVHRFYNDQILPYPKAEIPAIYSRFWDYTLCPLIT